ncbi:orexin receptor type 2-like [Haliotis rufescens]|uniref:orexin receptor type 2-like n=1 Tax=Haliotis rufescens TaxID=6454 RepID=UPI001EAFD017|nr:orexin receptor type 2-like [Haliotis rufescens]XP_046340268.1 orexin receptor type 2-like [Haliotis rufescens]
MFLNLSEEATLDFLRRHDNDYAIQAIPAILYLAILMLLGFVGNSVVCYVYLFKFQRITTTTYFVVSMAVLDLINCITSIPFEIIDLRHNFTLGASVVCKIMPVTVTFVSLASGNVLLAVAVDRYRKVCHAFRKQVTKTTAKLSIMLCCSLSAVMTLPSVFVFGSRTVELGENVTGSECSISDSFKGSVFPVVYNGVQFVQFLIATVAIIVLYVLVWRQISRQHKYVSTLTTSANTGGTFPVHVARSNEDQVTSVSTGDLFMSSSIDCEQGKSISNISKSQNSTFSENDNASTFQRPTNLEDAPQLTHSDKPGCTVKVKDTLRLQRETQVRKTTLMLFLISLVFIISFLPHLGIMAATVINKNLYDNLQGAQVAAYNICQRSYFINSAANPIIYSFCSVNFRRAVRDMIKRKSGKDRLRNI